MASMDPPVRSIPLPSEVAALISDAMTRDLTGSITLHFHRGRIGSVEHKQVLPIARKLTVQTAQA